jgi:hypothetical protein
VCKGCFQKEVVTKIRNGDQMLSTHAGCTNIGTGYEPRGETESEAYGSCGSKPTTPSKMQMFGLTVTNLWMPQQCYCYYAEGRTHCQESTLEESSILKLAQRSHKTCDVERVLRAQEDITHPLYIVVYYLYYILDLQLTIPFRPIQNLDLGGSFIVHPTSIESYNLRL